jgi:hypothetical protein
MLPHQILLKKREGGFDVWLNRGKFIHAVAYPRIDQYLHNINLVKNIRLAKSINLLFAKYHIIIMKI